MKWLAAAISLIVVAWLFQMSLLSYAMYCLLAILLTSHFVTKSWVDGLRAKRICDRLEANVGQEVLVSITIGNKGRLPIAWVILEDVLPRGSLFGRPPRLGVRGERVRFTSILAQGTKTLFYQLQCNRRGFYQIGPLTAETGDFFGLQKRYRVLASPQFLLVLPKIVPLEAYEVSSKRPLGELRMQHRLYEDPTRIAGVREYVAGDPINRVHWKATARTGMLHCKTYEPSSIAGATLIVDFHKDSHPAKDEPLRSELAITTAASIAHALYLTGDQVGLVSNGNDAAERERFEDWKREWSNRDSTLAIAQMSEKRDRLTPIIVPTRRGEETYDALIKTLARIELSEGMSFPRLIIETQQRIPRNATVIAILSRVSPEHAVALLGLRRQGYAVSAILNVYEPFEFSEIAGPLVASGIECRHLATEQSIATICRQWAIGY